MAFVTFRSIDGLEAGRSRRSAGRPAGLRAGGAGRGCIKGAAVGGVAGHVAGKHGVLGAAAGCVGHHEAAKKEKAQQQAAAAYAGREWRGGQIVEPPLLNSKHPFGLSLACPEDVGGRSLALRFDKLSVTGFEWMAQSAAGAFKRVSAARRLGSDAIDLIAARARCTGVAGRLA